MNFIFAKRHRFDLLVELIKTNFMMRYQNSVLGILWVVIKPYATFVVMYFIWSNFGGETIPNYALYLMLGVMFYTYFNELLVYGQMALLDRANIILKANFPRQIVVIAALVSALINLFINMIFVFIIMLLRNVPITLGGFLYFLLIVVIIFIFSLGICFYVSVFTVRFRDLKNIFDLGLFILYWASPVFFTFDASKVGNTFVSIIQANPIGIVLNQVRAGFGIYAEINLPLMLIYLFASLLLAYAGWKYFNTSVKKVAEFF